MAEVLDPQTRMDDLLFIAGHLIDVLEQENDALERNRYDQLRELVDQKTRLSRAYEIRVLGLAKTPDALEGVDQVLIDELKQRGDRIQELIEINARELSINIQVGRRFMEVLSETVKDATPTAGTYGANGAAGATALSKNTKSASVAIDEQL